MTLRIFNKSLVSEHGPVLGANSLRRMNLWVMAMISSAGLALAPFTSTYATSSWDDALATTGALQVEYTGVGPIDITDRFLSIMRSACPTEYASLVETTANSNGKMIVVQEHGDPDMDPDRKHVNIGWTTDTNKNIEFENSPANSAWAYIDHRVQLYTLSDGVIRCAGSGGSSLLLSPYTSVPTFFVYSSTYPVTYPSGYSGIYLSSVGDIDSDGLSPTAESAQGTSDYNADTDGDGIKDNIESVNYPARNAAFCDTTTGPPYTCAYPDPLFKDLYVEVDWMDSGTESYKPSSTQLGKVVDGLDDNGYNVHIDAGEYGGGNELSSYIEYLPFAHDSSSVGFFDLKNGNVSESISANFNPNRQGIWRYLISGYGYDDERGSSGVSYAGSDNIFISYGTIEDDPVGFEYNDLDTAIAGTMVHEIGHSLCMSKTKHYSYQSSACIYSGVDSDVFYTYDSSLNYTLQMLQHNLSDGSNLLGDHDDWGAIESQGIADFSEWDTGDRDFSPGVTAAQVQEAVKKGIYGKVVRGDKVYDLKNNKMYDSKDKKVYAINKDRQKVGVSSDQDKWRGQLSHLLK